MTVQRSHWVLALLLWVVWIVRTQGIEGHWRTFGLLVITSMLGLAMIHRASRVMADEGIRNLGIGFIGAMGLVMLMLGRFWERNLASEGALEGDQERFYVQAYEFAQGSFTLDYLPSLNYTGVLYVYGAVFEMFGHNPYAPALLNLFLTAIAAVLFVRVVYKVRPAIRRNDWVAGMWLLIPEVLLQATMTSRDALVMPLMTIATLLLANHAVTDKNKRSFLKLTVWLIPLLGSLAVLRTTALIPVLVSGLVLVLVFKRRWRTVTTVVGALAASGLIWAAQNLSVYFGGYEIGIGDVATVAGLGEPDLLYEYQWADQSIGQLFVPDSWWQSVLFLVPRLLLYVIAPLPNVSVSIGGLIGGDWMAWQLFMILLSTLLYIAVAPLSVVGLIEAIRRNHQALAIHVPFWITILAVVGGVTIIHERYRLMAVPLFWGAVWLGRTATRQRILEAYFVWALMLLAGAAFYVVYKW